jgi:hypothetical protein
MIRSSAYWQTPKLVAPEVAPVGVQVWGEGHALIVTSQIATHVKVVWVEFAMQTRPV